MDLNKLKEYLQENNIPQDSYSINEINNESLCIIENNSRWSIFYSERGLRTEEYIYKDKSAAINHFLDRLSKNIKYKYFIELISKSDNNTERKDK